MDGAPISLDPLANPATVVEVMCKELNMALGRDGHIESLVDDLLEQEGHLQRSRLQLG